MMSSLLLNSGSKSTFWSDAFIHSVYIKNGLPLSEFHNQSPPYKMLSCWGPNLTNLEIFSSKVIVRKPGKDHSKETWGRPRKISYHNW